VTVAILMIIALLAGAGLSLQAGINAQLGARAGENFWAALASFLIGGVFLAPFALAGRGSWPSAGTIAQIPWWVWSGGLLGAAYVMITILVTPKLGAAPFFGLVVAGQMAMALLLDQFGWIGFPQHSINPMRILGSLLVLGGAILIRAF
jgi:bacterial/archaeal transporter family-2 protein